MPHMKKKARLQVRLEDRAAKVVRKYAKENRHSLSRSASDVVMLAVVPSKESK